MIVPSAITTVHAKQLPEPSADRGSRGAARKIRQRQGVYGMNHRFGVLQRVAVILIMVTLLAPVALAQTPPAANGEG